MSVLCSYWSMAHFGWHSGEAGLSDKTYYTTLVRSFGSVGMMGKLYFRIALVLFGELQIIRLNLGDAD